MGTIGPYINTVAAAAACEAADFHHSGVAFTYSEIKLYTGHFTDDMNLSK